MIQWFRSLFRGPATATVPAHGQLTFGESTVGRTLSRTRLLLKKQLWIWPIIAVVLLAVVGLGIRTAIERTMEHSLQSQLETLLNVERAMLETWFRVQETNATSLANDLQVREFAEQLIEASRSPLPGDSALSAVTAEPVPSQPVEPDVAPPTGRSIPVLNARLARELGPGMSAHDFVSYFVADQRFQIVASSHTELVGKEIPQEYLSIVRRALEGTATVSPPFPSMVMMKDEFGELKTDVPTMHVCVPIRDISFQVVAVLGLRIRPEREFTRILRLGTFGDSGETYAIDKKGTLVSSSRFDEELIMLRLLPDVEHSRSLLNLSIRDPGGDLSSGYRPLVRRAELPLTKAAAALVAGNSGIDLDGYRSYRGVLTVGAWHWLPRYDLGIITEISHAEAYRPLTILQRTFFSIFGLLVLTSLAIFVFTLVVARLQREAQRAAVEAKHLGQYRLEEKLGAGAMGVVYKGHHAMLRRPTAIKMLNIDKVNEASIQRFEREVQMTCMLNHPNTVAIYDYGRTPEGVFYYAMEYLDGIDLQALVDKYGPQPEGRVIRILKQICGSLYEAHSLGLVHRDIKPANVMLNRRGSEPDVVKVLDFGLVRALDESQRAKQSGGLSGTPLYMSPEAIQTPDLVDPRSDLYAVGAIGYFLLTGQPVFSAKSLVELCQMQIDTVPETPSHRSGRTVSAELESAILACLEKSRARRPQTARDLAALLDRSPAAHGWSLEEAEAWWGRHTRQRVTGSSVTRGDASGTASDNLDATMSFEEHRGRSANP